MQQSSNSRTLEKAVAAELDDEQRLLATVVRAHIDTCDFTRDKVEPMLQRAREQPSYTACPPTLVSFLLLLLLKCFWVTSVNKQFPVKNKIKGLKKLSPEQSRAQAYYIISRLVDLVYRGTGGNIQGSWLSSSLSRWSGLL